MALQTAQWIIITFCYLYQNFCGLLVLVCDPIVYHTVTNFGSTFNSVVECGLAGIS